MVKILLDGNTALLHDACRRDNQEMIRLLINGGADLNAEDDYGNTPLFFASDKGHLDLVRFLIEKGADVNAKNNYGKTLLLALEKSDQNLVNYSRLKP